MSKRFFQKCKKNSKKEKKEKSKRNVGWVVRRQFGPVLSFLAALLHFCIVTFYLPCTHSNLNFAFFANLLSAFVQINTLLSHLFCARSLFEVTSFFSLWYICIFYYKLCHLTSMLWGILAFINNNATISESRFPVFVDLSPNLHEFEMSSVQFCTFSFNCPHRANLEITT